MLDIKKFEKIFDDCKNITTDEYSELFFNLEDKEKIEFYVAVYNFFLQTNQGKYLANHGISFNHLPNTELTIIDNFSQQ